MFQLFCYRGERQQILVPFCVESALSGVMRRLGAGDTMTYTRTFTIPETEDWADKRVRLVFEAVDYEAEVSVNGQTVGSHRGGYDRCGLSTHLAVIIGICWSSGSYLTSLTS